MMIPIPVFSPVRLLRAIFVEIPRDRRLAQVEVARARIQLLEENGLLSPEEQELRVLLALGMAPRKAFRRIQRQRGTRLELPSPERTCEGPRPQALANGTDTSPA